MDKIWWNEKSAMFAAWLVDNSAQVLPPTNQWEQLRFKVAGKTHVVYANAKGRITMDEQTQRLATKFMAGVSIPKRAVIEPPKPLPQIVMPSEPVIPDLSPSFEVWNLRKHRHKDPMRSLFLSAMTKGAEVAHCGCTALPWEDCRHTRMAA